MQFGIVADHAGFVLKEPIALHLQALGHEVIDFGATKLVSDDDYPDRVTLLAEAVAHGEVQRGGVNCGSGVGACIMANKFPGVRSCVCHDTYSARQAVEHDDMNKLALGALVVGPSLVAELVSVFAAAYFSAEPRHLRRLQKLIAQESRQPSEGSKC